MNEPQAPRVRTSFAKLEQPLPLPNLIDIQKKSWEWFLSDGLSETIADINPIKDYSEKLLVQFGEHQFGEPSKSLAECRNKDMTFSAPLTMKVAFINEETGEIREQSVFMGDFPMMTERGTFIIHGTERVVVTQLVRSPGAYIMEPKQAEREKQVLVANLMPQRGSWLELEIDKKGTVNVRIDRKRKFPVTVLLRAMGYGANDELLALFDDSVYIRNTLEKDTTGSQEEALVELFRKQRPGEPPTLDGATAMLKGLFFDPKRYDLSRVGRHKLNVRLHNHIKPADRPDADVRVLVNEDIIELIKRLISLPSKLGVPDDAKDYAAEASVFLATRREEIAHEIDEYEHFGNRRLRTVGELVQDAFRIGLARMERVIRERLTTEDPDTIVPATLVNIRPVVAALKEFFGSSQLSQFMDQTNSLSGLTHRRRLSALGAGGLTRERAPIEVRDVHPTHYGRMCPIETPEGPNIGLIGSLASMATVDEFGFIRAPYRKVVKGKVTDEIVYLDASEEEEEIVDPKTGEIRYVTIAQANAAVRHQDRQVRGRADPRAHARRRRHRPGAAGRHRLHGREPDPAGLGGHGPHPVPRARRRQPRPHGLQHAAPGRAAAPRRGAVRRHRHGVPRRRRHRRRGHRRARRQGRLRRRRPHRDRRRQGRGRHLRPGQVHALQPGHADPPEAASCSPATRCPRAPCSPTGPRPTAASSRSAATSWSAS